MEQTREIDLCAKLANFFGPNGYLAAQGTNQIDLKIKGPTLQAEVKYFRPPAKQWTAINDDWNWLINIENTNNNFNKNAWLVFFPSISLYSFPNCLSVTRSNGTRFSLNDYAPFAPFVIPENTKNGVNEKLRWSKTPDQVSIIALYGGKKIRVDIVGSNSHPVWCAIYSRLTPTEAKALEASRVKRIDIA